jgi:hypothetical protein
MRSLAPDLLITARTQRWNPEEFLRTLIEAEITAWDESNARTRMRTAAFPVAKTPAEFDVAASSIPQPTFDYLASLEMGQGCREHLPDRAGPEPARLIWRSRSGMHSQASVIDPPLHLLILRVVISETVLPGCGVDVQAAEQIAQCPGVGAQGCPALAGQSDRGFLRGSVPSLGGADVAGFFELAQLDDQVAGGESEDVLQPGEGQRIAVGQGR